MIQIHNFFYILCIYFNIMRKAVSFFLVLFISIQVFSQKFHPNYFDGELYIKIKSENKSDFGNTREIPKELITSKLSCLLSYTINSSLFAFHQADDKNINSVIRLKIKEYKFVDQLIKQLEASELVEYAEKVPLKKVGLVPNDLGSSSATASGNQWHLHKINAPLAWDISTGNASIMVAIVDDAVQITHPDLAPNIYTNPNEIPNNNVDDDGNGYVDDVNGWDAADNDNNPNPPNTNFSHGTHVAGIAGARSNNGTGIASIGYSISILPVKSTTQAQVVTHAYEGVVYAADLRAHIINCSWGGGGFSNTEQNIINYATNKGCFVIAASGNNGTSTVFYPAGYANVISVANTTSNDAKASSSNFGTWIDISAPGSSIRSTVPNNAYQSFSGTSMASPLVAGLCGLMLSHHPSMTRSQLEQCLLSTADNINTQNPVYINQLGSGRINARQAMLCVDNLLSAPPTAALALSQYNACPNSDIVFGISNSSGIVQSYQWYFPGGNPSSSTSSNPVVQYASLGSYPVILKLTNNFGSDSVQINNAVNINVNNAATFWRENFDAGWNGFTTQNNDAANGWQLNQGANGAQSAMISLHNYINIGERDAIISPEINISNYHNITLQLDYAYNKKPNSLTDSLIVYVSTNGGLNYSRVFQIGESGSGNFRTIAANNTAFIPSNLNEWCAGNLTSATCINIDLSVFDGNQNLKLKIESYNGNGNNLWIDNITLSGICSPLPAPQAGFSANKTEVCKDNSISFTAVAQNFNANYQWILQGATPSTATGQSVTVSYSQAGTFSVGLVVQNQAGVDSLWLYQYITVNNAPATPIISESNDTLYANVNAQQYQWLYASGSPISNAVSSFYAPPFNGTYRVRVSNAVCFSESENYNFTKNTNVSIDQMNENEIAIYPNPSSDFIILKQFGYGNIIKIKDINGKEIEQLVIKEKLQKFDVSILSQGIYFIEFFNGNELKQLKWIKAK
jgi:PKD repeat protein